MCPGRQVPGHITWLTTSARRPVRRGCLPRPRPGRAGSRSCASRGRQGWMFAFGGRPGHGATCGQPGGGLGDAPAEVACVGQLDFPTGISSPWSTWDTPEGCPWANTIWSVQPGGARMPPQWVRMLPPTLVLAAMAASGASSGDLEQPYVGAGLSAPFGDGLGERVHVAGGEVVNDSDLRLVRHTQLSS